MSLAVIISIPFVMTSFSSSLIAAIAVCMNNKTGADKIDAKRIMIIKAIVIVLGQDIVFIVN
jgi:hypothetical protein